MQKKGQKLVNETIYYVASHIQIIINVMKYIMKYLLLGLIVFSSCQSKNTSKQTEDHAKFSKEELTAQQNAWDKVMAIHDAIMPQMGALDQAEVGLDNKIKATTDKKSLNELNNAKHLVQAADKIMWDWMYALIQLKDLRETKSHAEIMSYLSKELTRIKKVKEKMELSIKTSNELIK